jgi:hypothetical protein
MFLFLEGGRVSNISRSMALDRVTYSLNLGSSDIDGGFESPGAGHLVNGCFPAN